MDVRIPKTLISSCSNAFQQQVYRVVFSNDRFDQAKTSAHECPI